MHTLCVVFSQAPRRLHERALHAVDRHYFLAKVTPRISLIELGVTGNTSGTKAVFNSGLLDPVRGSHHQSQVHQAGLLERDIRHLETPSAMR